MANEHNLVSFLLLPSPRRMSGSVNRPFWELFRGGWFKVVLVVEALHLVWFRLVYSFSP